MCHGAACSNHFCSTFILMTYSLNYPMAHASPTLIKSPSLHLAGLWAKLDCNCNRHAVICVKKNCLSCNYSKCNIMLIRVSHPATCYQLSLSNLTLNGRVLSAVNQLIILGINIRSGLCWTLKAQRT